MQIKVTPTQVREYQRILTAPWEKGLSDAVIRLAWSVVSLNKAVEAAAIRPLFTPQLDGLQLNGPFALVVQRIAGFGQYAGIRGLPPLPTRVDLPRRVSKSLREAVQLTACLALPGVVGLDGDVPFFRDVQALAFQAAIHEVLPAARDRHIAEHDVLLHALVMFAYEYFETDPAHSCYLRSQLFDYLGWSEARLQNLAYSLRLTPPDDHSYLTKAQEYWSELLDHGQHEAAETFLLSLYRSASVEQQAEVREMIDAAFRVITGARTSA